MYTVIYLLDVVLKKLKTGKLPVLIKCHQKNGKQRNSTAYSSDTTTLYINRTQSRDGQRDASSLSQER